MLLPVSGGGTRKNRSVNVFAPRQDRYSSPGSWAAATWDLPPSPWFDISVRSPYILSSGSKIRKRIRSTVQRFPSLYAPRAPTSYVNPLYQGTPRPCPRHVGTLTENGACDTWAENGARDTWALSRRMKTNIVSPALEIHAHFINNPSVRTCGRLTCRQTRTSRGTGRGFCLVSSAFRNLPAWSQLAGHGSSRRHH